MEYSDLGDSYEWESEFLEWLKHRKGAEQISESDSFDFPEQKIIYSENFILQNFFDEN
jgi:hypothetical protein